jgi:hypothetical protein
MNLINFIFNILILFIYFITYFSLTKFNINNDKILNHILLFIFFIVFPGYAVLLNNLFLYLFKRKREGNWLRIPNKYGKIFTNIEIGISLIILIEFGMILGINKNEVKSILKNVKTENIIIDLLIVIILVFIIRFTTKIVKKIFLKNGE